MGNANDVGCCLAGNIKRQLSPRDKRTDGKALVELPDGVATVKATDGRTRKYKIRVLQMMLVKLYKFTSHQRRLIRCVSVSVWTPQRGRLSRCSRVIAGVRCRTLSVLSLKDSLSLLLRNMRSLLRSMLRIFGNW